MNPDESTSAADEPTPAEGVKDEPRAPQTPRRSRLSLLLLVGGAVLGLAPLVQRLPHEHQIDIRFEGGANDVTRLDVDWMRLEGGSEGEIVMGSSRSFAAGQAPENVNLTVHLPNGAYALDIRVEHVDHVDAIQRRVTLGDADRIAIPLRADRVRP